MALLFYATLLAGAYLFLRKLIGHRSPKEEQEERSRVGASIGNALPAAFGGQASSSLPEPDTSDRLEPEASNVYVMAPPVPPPTYHPFREPEEARRDDVATPAPARRKKKSRKKPVAAAKPTGE